MLSRQEGTKIRRKKKGTHANINYKVFFSAVSCLYNLPGIWASLQLKVSILKYINIP